MKNVIIPTVLGEDTIYAVQTALLQAKNNSCSIILLILKEVPDTFSATASLRELSYRCSKNQEEVLERCREVFKIECNANLKIHHQFGISGPLLRNMMEFLEAELVILTPFFKNSQISENRHLVKLLLKSKYPLLHLNSGNVRALNSALYLEYKTTKATINEMQHVLDSKFNFRIVSRTKLNDDLLENANPVIAEAIATKQIDLLVEARKATRNKNNGITTANVEIDLPVLSIYEEDIMN